MADYKDRDSRDSRDSRDNRDSRDSRGGGDRKKRGFYKKKVCRFCVDSEIVIDYKSYKVLKYFISERGKIVPRRISGNCAKHQRELTSAIKRARNIALIPFTSTTAL